MQNNWQQPNGREWHEAAMSGRPVLAFGMPRYGASAKRHALVFFETGRGWRESNNQAVFEVERWMPLTYPDTLSEGLSNNGK